MLFRFKQINNPPKKFHVVPGVLSPDECQQVIDYCLTLPREQAKVASNDDMPEIDQDYRDGGVRWVPLESTTKWVYEKILQNVLAVNADIYKFSLYGIDEMLQFTEYDFDGAHFDWHQDSDNTYLQNGGVSNSVRKLTCVCQLSSPTEYTGGDLSLFDPPNNATAPKDRGLSVVFPAWMPHQVSQIKSGKRYSLVAFISGPYFK